jgi:hypothetical protein
MAHVDPHPRTAGRPWAQRRIPAARRGALAVLGVACGVLYGSLLGVPAAHASSLRMVNLNEFQQQDLRALSMGNAFGPVARGEAALQYDPAGLATYDLDLKVDFGVSFLEEKGNFINDTLKLSSGTPTPADVDHYLAKYGGTTQTFILQTFPSAVANLGQFHFGLGAGNLDVRFDQLAFSPHTAGTLPAPTDSLAITSDRAQLGLGGLAFKLADGKALIGLTAKTVRYSEASVVQTYASLLTPGTKVDVSPTPTQYDQVAAYDAGLIYRVEWLPALKPQWSLTAYNIGGYKLKGMTPAGVPQTVQVPDTFNFGASLQPDFGIVHVLMSAEVEDLGDSIRVMDAKGVNQPRDESQRLHAGIEIGLFKTPTGNNWLNIRGGSNQGYLTYGAELNLGGFARAVYAYGTENFGYRKHAQLFRYEAYQLALGIAW